jgi:hypothetical protein
MEQQKPNQKPPVKPQPKKPNPVLPDTRDGKPGGTQRG